MERTTQPEVAKSAGGVGLSLAFIACLGFVVIFLGAADGIKMKALIAGLTGLAMIFLSPQTLKRLFLAVILLEVPIEIDIYLNHDEAIARLGALSGFNISLTTLCLAVLYSFWVAELASRFTKLDAARRPLAIPSITYFAVVAASLAVATDSLLVVAEIVILAQALLLFLYILFHVRSSDDVVFIVVIMVLAMLVQSLLALSALALGGTAVGPIKTGIGGQRLFGTFGSPVVLGGYLSLMLPPSLGLMLTPTRRSYRWLASIAFSVGALTLALTLTRGAWGGFLVATGITLLYAWRQGWISAAVPIMLTLLGVVLILVLRDDIVARVTAFDNASAQARLPLMDLAFRMIKDHPILGLGANNFAASMDQYLTIDFSQEWIFTVHNKYLLVWSETGIIGLAAFIWVMVAAVRRGWRAIRSHDRVLSPLAIGLTTGIIANMIHMTVDIFHSRTQVQMLWLVMALILAIASMTPATPKRASTLTRAAQS